MTDMLRGERAVVLDYLRHYRATFERTCEDLDAEQLARRSVPPSSLSLLGLLRHLAAVEYSWCRRVMERVQPAGVSRSRRIMTCEVLRVHGLATGKVLATRQPSAA